MLFFLIVQPARSAGSAGLAASGENNREFPRFSAQKKKKMTATRIDVRVAGVNGELRNNIYNHLAIYRLRSSAKLQQISVQQLFRQSEDDIAKALAPFGYYNPQVKAKLKGKPVEKGKLPLWEASFIVDPGEPVLVDSVKINLVGHGQENRALQRQVRSFALKPGAVLNQKIYEQEKKALIKTALAEGYLDAAFIRSEVRVDPKENRSWIWINLDTGNRFYFGEMSMVTESSLSLNSSLLQGYLPWKKGDPYDLAKLFALQATLYDGGFFTAVDVFGEPGRGENGFVPVTVKARIDEKNTTYTVGLGYATDVGLRAKLKWKNRLLSSRGDKMGGLLSIAEREKNVSLSYELPQGDNPRYDHYFLAVSYQEKSWGDIRSYPFSIVAGRDYSSPAYNLGANLELLEEDYRIGEREDSSRLLIPSANIGFVIADDLTLITNGIRFGAEIKGASKEIFSDVDFFRWTVSGKAVFSPLSHWLVRGRVVWGMTMGSGTASLPPSLRFYAGGDNSIRGYAYKSIGPEDDAGKVIGGRNLLVESVEVERMFGEYFGLAVFWDSGTVTNDTDPCFYHGAGLGLRVHMPFGEIKLDCATALSDSDYPLRIHFSVGGTL